MRELNVSKPEVFIRLSLLTRNPYRRNIENLFFFLFFEVAAHFSLSCNCHEKMENLLWDMNFIVV